MLNFLLYHGRRHATIRPVNVMEDEVAKTKSKIAPAKTSERDGNRYTRAARVLAKDDTIDVMTLADRAFMSETTAARCKEAWDAALAALIESRATARSGEGDAEEGSAQAQSRDRRNAGQGRDAARLAHRRADRESPASAGLFRGHRSRRDAREDRGRRAPAGESGSVRG
jgi:hypothetical protein